MNEDEIISFISHPSVAIKIVLKNSSLMYNRGETEKSISSMIYNNQKEPKELYEAIKNYIFSYEGIADFMLYTKSIIIDRELKKRIRRTKKEIPYNILAAIGDLRKFMDNHYSDDERPREAYYTILYIEHFCYINNNIPMSDS